METVEFKGRVLPKSWPKEVGKMVQEILEDYNNPETEVTLDMEIGNSLGGHKVESITVTRSKKIQSWTTVEGARE